MNTLKYILLLSLTFVLPVGKVFATHNRAGEITYRHITGYTYEFTVTTYTYKPSPANRWELYVQWGDGTTEAVPRKDTLSLPNDYLYNTYVAQHTFPGAGIYQILMEDPNRNLGVKNIPNSVNTVFSIETTMIVGPLTGSNSTPILLNPPIDKAAKGHIFIHNPAAYDPDGDSISYVLTVCTAESGQPIDGYSLPPASDSFYIDKITGDLIWNAPVDTGVYNVAMFVDEWRNNVRIGRITRDMQIDVYDTDNNPPYNYPIPDFCVEAGDTIDFEFVISDADNDPIQAKIVGEPILDNKATYDIIESSQGLTRGRFRWVTNCSDAQKQPYTMVLKSQDIVTNDISLVDITSFKIRVLHNAPKNLRTLPGTDTIRVEWDLSTCGFPTSYLIYRKIDPSGFIPDSCENGVPAYTGYELLDIVDDHYTNYYTDDNHGRGLVPGFSYCYLVTAFYSDNAESFASNEACTELIPGVPPMLQVSVEKDDISTGKILVSWAMPRDFDTIDDGPYRYVVERMSPGEQSYTTIATIPTLDLTDTVYIDSNINTLVYPYVYSVKLFYQIDDGSWVEHKGSETASSLYLNLNGADNSVRVELAKRSPWLNYEYRIFRKPETGETFDSIGTTYSTTFTDYNLPNDVSFTYKSKSLGMRPLFGGEFYFINKSHINTAQALDTVAPCPPITEVTSHCDSSYNLLTWTSPKTLCGEKDNVAYKIYYRPTLDDEFQLVGTQEHPDTTFIHNSNLVTLAGQYGVTAIDSFNNVSKIIPVIIDSCLMFELPNVFTPDNDGKNDTYYSYNLGGFVQKVDMQIFNRYGQLIFRTDNPDIAWDGKTEITKKPVPTGVYYYICTVYEPRLTGEVMRTLKGFIHVFSDGTSNTNMAE
jgi:gliding motility-associated-like protein